MDLPSQLRVESEWIGLSCGECDNRWEVKIQKELGIIVDDDYDICPECGVRAEWAGEGN
jgi:hypothetical protein